MVFRAMFWLIGREYFFEYVCMWSDPYFLLAGMFFFVLLVVVHLYLVWDGRSRRLMDMVSRACKNIFKDLAPPRVLSPGVAHNGCGSRQPSGSAIAEEDVHVENVQLPDVPFPRHRFQIMMIRAAKPTSKASSACART